MRGLPIPSPVQRPKVIYEVLLYVLKIVDGNRDKFGVFSGQQQLVFSGGRAEPEVLQRHDIEWNLTAQSVLNDGGRSPAANYLNVNYFIGGRVVAVDVPNDFEFLGLNQYLFLNFHGPSTGAADKF